jgi:hypothetical protein
VHHEGTGVVRAIHIVVRVVRAIGTRVRLGVTANASSSMMVTR